MPRKSEPKVVVKKPERVKGDRKHRVRLSGADIRALQDAEDHFRGNTHLNTRRRDQVIEKLSEIVYRYGMLDESARKAKK